ncbi:EPIDERMAL PATTERNING FACTOR-like protein 2 [Momordica charantia]|uniref:Epidermal patterning factor-like protein n=1 Tax=Momordica charantia TaxID=3673 RepID=A0A6J1BQW9_MOMCH|nr:EPIDERMAL PATTERNING FACTOR-like protein 2 [Momordica charantia]XP_022131876.1 EPIDERMAL PATTERNING FACTOR-like protein 2 [Momordica charantia]
MGSLQNWHRNKQHISISLLLLSVSIFVDVISMAEGRGIPTPLMEGRKVEAAGSWPELPEKVGMIRSQIGSRPPSCRRRCRECGGHCEAIQVPVALHDSQQNQRKKRSSHFPAAAATSAGASNKDMALSSEDETSNYKPISWKCKCGNFIFNP